MTQSVWVVVVVSLTSPQVLLNIHNEEVVVGVALTEESLHRRNITHFGPTTLRSTLCYGMLRSGLQLNQPPPRAPQYPDSDLTIILHNGYSVVD